jgi:hypothetical protein
MYICSDTLMALIRSFFLLSFLFSFTASFSFPLPFYQAFFPSLFLLMHTSFLLSFLTSHGSLSFVIPIPFNLFRLKVLFKQPTPYYRYGKWQAGRFSVYIKLVIQFLRLHIVKCRKSVIKMVIRDWIYRTLS